MDALWNFAVVYWQPIVLVVAIILSFLAGLSKSGAGIGKKIYTFLLAVFAFIQSALSETGGGPSSKRLQNFFASTILVPCVAFCLVYTAMNNPEMTLPLFLAVLSFIAAMFGIQMAGKKDEIKDPNNAPDAPGKPGTPQAQAPQTGDAL
jgi:hypothetical protein